MSTTHTITYSEPHYFTTNRVDNLRPGDEVLVYDAVSECDEWYIVADVVQRGVRTKIRLLGMNFYFDSSVIKCSRFAHYSAPARYQKPKEEVEPHQDRYINEDLYGRNDFVWPTWLAME